MGSFVFLPTVQVAPAEQEHNRSLKLMGAILEEDDEDALPFTEELRRALARGKATVPGDDGITYSVLRLLQKVPENPLLHFYNLCLSLGYVPIACTRSTITPIPKPGTDKFRPVSLTSCFCKAMKRMLLNRLMYSMEEMLSDRLFGFLPQRSTHHCLVEFYTRLSHNTVVAFIDLKSAFDVAHKHVNLD